MREVPGSSPGSPQFFFIFLLKCQVVETRHSPHHRRKTYSSCDAVATLDAANDIMIITVRNLAYANVTAKHSSTCYFPAHGEATAL